MVWNVYCSGFDCGDIKIYNIFQLEDFSVSVKKLLKEINDKKEFAQKLDSECFYYFCSKVEYEIGICCLPSCLSDKEKCKIYLSALLGDVKKIDIYSQIKLNWDVFVDYVWRNK